MWPENSCTSSPSVLGLRPPRRLSCLVRGGGEAVMAPRRGWRCGLCGLLLLSAACTPRAAPTAAPVPVAKAKVAALQPSAETPPAPANVDKKPAPSQSALAPALLAQVKLK